MSYVNIFIYFSSFVFTFSDEFFFFNSFIENELCICLKHSDMIGRIVLHVFASSNL